MAEALQPDILLLDTQMPGLGSIEALPQIRKKSPWTHVGINPPALPVLYDSLYRSVLF